ncbi:MAG TPA: Smr/MutS family protein [Terriglobales bacterium]|nr:Smr/MutS family protein [Terriglobales bacterium]
MQFNGTLGTKGKSTVIINLENGRPTRNEAVLRLAFELRKARSAGAEVLKIIHGYGSSGVGGVLRFQVQSELRQSKERGEIRAFCPGEQWRISNEIAWDILKKYPELKQDSDLGRANKGITMVLL